MAIKVQGTTVIDDSRQLSVTGTSTLGSVKVDSGIVTSVTGVVTYFGDGSNLTDLTGVSVGTYGSNNVAPIITVDANGRITGITTAAITGTDAIASVSEDTNPQLGGNLDLNSKLINGTGGINITGVATATAFHTGAEGSAVRITSNTISGPAELFIDPAAVGDDTGAVRIKGDLYVDGTTTQINSTTIELADFIVGIATTATTDSLADGAGITIGPDNTFLYDHSNTSLKSSENLNLATGKTYKINGTDVLSATTLGSNVVNSSLTSVGTLTELNVTGIVTASSFSGNATTASTATLATNVNLTANNSTDETVYLTFADGATGSQGLETDTGLTYNPSTNILSTTATYAGGLRTIANSADNEYCVPFTLLTSAPTSSYSQTDVRVDDGLKYNPDSNILYTTATNANYAGGLRTIANSADNEYCVPFTLLTSAPTSAYAETNVRVDDGLKYNPDSNILYTTATNANLALNVNLLANNTSNETVYLTFADGTSGSQRLETDTNLTYNPYTNTIGGNISNSSLATNVDLLANNTENQTSYIPFADGFSGSQRLETDTNLTYNPYTNLISGNISNAQVATNVNLTANNTENQTSYIPFADGASGTQALETDTSLTYNPYTNLISGNISNANVALNVNLLENNTENQTSYIPFADGASGSQRLETDTALTYNPYTNLISGNISNANVATNVDLVDANNANMTASIVFADGATGSKRLETDSGLTYNPITNLISGTITSVNLTANNSTDETVYLTFADGATGSQGLETDSGLTYNPSTNLISGNISNAQVATNVNLTANNSTDETVYLTFADGATGTQGLETDTVLNYNPSTNTLTAGTFSGSGSSLTGLTGASAATYGSSDIAPVITVDANGRITGITTAAISGSGAIASVSEDTNPQLGGDLDLNSNDITGTGNMNVTGIITATTFSGSGASLTSIPNSALDNSSIAIGGVTFNLGATDLTPAFDLQDAINYPFTSLTGIATHIVGDTTPQLGGTLETNGNLIKFGDSSGATDDRLMFGDDNDLSIYHTGSISYISEQGPGALRILSNQVRIRNGADNQDIAKFVAGGQVELYYNNSKKFETTGIGVSIVGTGNTATITGPSELVLDPAAVGDATGKVVILGDLQVDGTQTVINSTTLTVDDKSIVLASGAADSSAANGAGIEVDGASATFQYAHSGTKWVANKDLQAEAFIKNGGTSSQFLKADGSVDSSTYLTAESDTLDSVTGRGSTTTNNIDVGEVTADGLNISGISTLTNQAEVRSDDGSQGRIDFYCEVSNAHYTRLQAAAHADYSGNATVTLPSSSGTLLLTNGSGANLTSLNASNLGSGTVPDARFPSTLPTVSGANLTSLNASNLGSGTVPDARFPSTLPAVSAANLTNLTGVGVGTYGSASLTPIITVDSNGRITAISTVTSTGSGGISSVSQDTSPQLGGDLDLNSNDVTGTGNIDITGNVYASGLVGIGTDNPIRTLHIIGNGNPAVLIEDGSGTDQTSTQYKSSATHWSTGIIHGEDAFVINKSDNLTNGTAALYISSTNNVGLSTESPTSKLDVVGNAKISGVVTATSFVKSSNSGGFLKADGTEDTNTYLTSFTETNDLSSAVTWANVPNANITESSVTQHQAALSITESQISDLQSYLTSYTETQTLDDVVGLGSATTQTITVGTATTGVVIRPDGNLNVSGVSTFTGNISVGSTTNIIRKVTDINSWVAVDSDTSFSITNQQNAPTGLYFKSDGTKMFVVGTQSPRDVDEYALSTAWDITTASHTTGYSINSQDTGPQGLYFSPNGENMFVAGNQSNSILHYTLSTGWDLTSTVSYVGNFSVSSQATLPTGVTFGDSGTKMYVTGRTNDSIHQYNLSSAYTITSGVSHAHTLDVSASSIVVPNGLANPHGISISSDGTKIWVIDPGEDIIVQINLGTAYDLSTATYNGDFTNVYWAANTAYDFYIDESAEKGFVLFVGGSDDCVREIDIANPGLSIEANPTVRSANINLNNNVQVKGRTWFEDAIIVNGSQSSFFQHNLQVQGTLTCRGPVDLGDGSADRIQFGASDDAKIYYDGTDNYFDLQFSSADNNGFRILDSSASELFRVEKDGKVGIGTNSPTAKLDVRGNANVTGIATATSFSGSGSSLTGLTGASAGSYGSTGLTPVITVDANGRITGITTVTTAGSGGGLAEISDDTTPQLGGDLDLNSNDITGTGNMNVTGIITATSFSGNIISESSVPNSALENTTIYLGGVNIALGATDATPAFDLSDATNYPYSSLTGISTDIVYDTTPQLGGNLDLNSNNITGTGNIDITGTLDVSSTATFGADANDAVIYGTSKILRMGGSSGFQIQEEGTSAQITQGTGALRFFYDSGNQYKWAIFNNAGSVELYHANNKKFETSNTGVTITGTASATSFSGSGSSLTGLTGASAATYGSSSATPVITVDANGRITGITTAAVSGGGGDVVDDTTPQLGGTLETNGNLIQFGDSSGATDDRLRFGAGNDLQIWHNGANSYVSQQSDVGDLYLVSLNDDNDVIIQTDDGSGNTTDYFRADGSTGEAKLFWYGSEKIKTGHNGVTITGTASATSFSGSGSSLTGLTGASAATYGSSTVTPIITVDSSGRITGITTAATAGGGGGGGSGTVTGISSDGEIVGTGVTAINFVGTGITVSITGSTADITIPTSEKSVHREVATEGQTVVPSSGTVEYTVGHCDVYLNGSKLDSTEYTATNGTSVTLTTGASVGDIIEVIGFQVGVELNLVGLADLVDDTTPQLGGNLDLNSRLIQGTGGINITGIATATSFSGSGANLTGIPNSALDNSTISVGGVTFNLGGTDTTPAFNLSDATNYPYTSLTGISTEIVYDTTPQLGGDLDLNSNNITGTGNMNVTGIVTATSFTGNVTGNITGDVTGDVTGTADNATNVTVADESSDTSCFPLFVTAATGDLAPKSGSNLTFDSSAGILGATTFQGNLDVAGLLKEGVNIVNGKLSANTNIDLADGMVHYFDTTETATSTPNIRVNASTTLNSAMSVGEAITVVLISSAAAAGYSAQLTIDGAAVTERWLGGSAPSTGGSSGLDVYTYTIIKVTSAPAYSVLANVVNFA